MQFLIKVSLGWAVVKVYIATAGLQWDQLMARHFTRGHIIIVAGRAAKTWPPHDRDSPQRTGNPLVDKTALALDLTMALAPQNSVVLCISGIEPGTRTRLWDAGVKVISGELTTRETLETTGASRATTLIAMRDNFSENLALALAATSPSTNNTTLECKCMLEPLAIRRDLKAEDYFDSDVLPRVRLFNESELIARRILREHPPDEPVAATEAGVHLLLVGNGSVGQSVLVNLARIGHYRSAKRPKVTIVDRRVQENWLETLRAFPALTDWLEVELEEIRIEDVENNNVSRWLEDARPITMVFVCTKDEIANLRIARKLVESMNNRSIATGINPAKVVALDPPGGIVLSDFAKRGVRPDQFSLFSLVSRDNPCVAEGLLSDVDDSRAKLFHHDYCAKDDEKCAANPGRSKAINNKPWEALTEGMRDANRNVTDHFDVKLRAIGCKALPKGTAHPVTLTDQEHEILARMEHDRWWADKALAGWTHAPDRNDLQLLHPDMIPYEQLSDKIKQWDRNSVIKMIEILDSEGLVVTRTDDLVTG
jgi:hypothetical protein